VTNEIISADDGTAADPPTKQGLRTHARLRRSTLGVATLSAHLASRIASLPEYGRSETVLIYLAMPEEVSVEVLIERGGPSRRFLIPRCAAARRLALHPYVLGRTTLRTGPFGIREPESDPSSEVEPQVVDLVIVPALMLSESGDRLGYGGGYYDRLLPRLRSACIRVAAVPDALLVPRLPHDPWDATIDIIVTEARIIRPAGRRQPEVTDAVS
jgi:5-formyltetrahydrofolate cyclo-ligase